MFDFFKKENITEEITKDKNIMTEQMKEYEYNAKHGFLDSLQGLVRNDEEFAKYKKYM